MSIAVIAASFSPSVAAADVHGEFVFSGVEDETHVAEFEVIFTLSEPVAPSLTVRVRVVPTEGAIGSLSIGFLAGAEGDLGDCEVNTAGSPTYALGPERSIATCEWPTPAAGEVGRPRLALTPTADADGQWTIVAEASNTEIDAAPDWQTITSTNITVPPAGAGLARDDVSLENPVGSVVRVDHLANDDESLLGETFRLVHPVYGDGYIDMEIEGEGWWWALQDGQGSYWIEFEPNAALVGDPTPQQYSIRDAEGTVHSALVTITFAWPTTTTGAPTTTNMPTTAATTAPTLGDVLPATGSGTLGALLAGSAVAAGLALVAAARRRTV